VYPAPSRVRGFTLLEAVVALAIFAMGASALYAWVNTNLITLQRADAVNTRSALIESAVEYMRTVDPEESPSGSVEIGSLGIEWSSEASDYEDDVLDEQNNKTINKAKLYQSEVNVYRDGKLLYTFDMWLLGLRQVRTAADVVFD